MKRVIIKCGCGKTVSSNDYDDGEKKFVTDVYAGECEQCLANKGGYTEKEWGK